MSTPNVYVFCDQNCKYEGMTKEQILAAIMQAVNDGAISDIDAGFITKIQEQNDKENLQFWVGSTAEYNAIEEKDPETLYILTDENTEQAIIDIKKDVDEIIGGTITVAKATNAESADEASEATDVKEKINGVNISQIFERDGKTVKNATYASKLNCEYIWRTGGATPVIIPKGLYEIGIRYTPTSGSAYILTVQLALTDKDNTTVATVSPSVDEVIIVKATPENANTFSISLSKSQALNTATGSGALNYVKRIAHAV